MYTLQTKQRFFVRLMMLTFGLGSAIALWPAASNAPNALSNWQHPTVQQTSLEFIIERRF